MLKLKIASIVFILEKSPLFDIKQESSQLQDTNVTIKIKPNILTSEPPRASLTISEQNRETNFGAISMAKVVEILCFDFSLMFSLLVMSVDLNFIVNLLMLIGKWGNCSDAKKAYWCFWGIAREFSFKKEAWS